MSKEKQLFEDLVEIFEEEYEKRRLITPQNTAEKMTAKGYRKQSEGQWTYSENKKTMKCTRCRLRMKTYDVRRYCPNCGARMKGGAE